MSSPGMRSSQLIDETMAIPTDSLYVCIHVHCYILDYSQSKVSYRTHSINRKQWYVLKKSLHLHVLMFIHDIIIYI